ncbi:MAG: hypothetical protein AAF354_13225 [Pseudomonadota bacterium]
MDEEEKAQLIDWLAINPEAGAIMAGTKGVRKIRWRYRNSSKRGRLRIIYYFRDLNIPVYFYLFSKGKNFNPPEKEKGDFNTI